MVATVVTVNRRELIQIFTLNSICDDYENLVVSITGPVTKLGARCGVAIDETEIVSALTELVELGLAKAFCLGGQVVEEIAGVPSLREMEDPMGAWFMATDAGIKLQLANWERWPFDEQDELRKDWRPPQS